LLLILPALGIGDQPIRNLRGMVVKETLFASGCLGIYVLYLTLPRRWFEIVIVTLAGLAIEWPLWSYRSHIMGPISRVLSLGVGLGAAALTALILRAVTTRGEERKQAIECLRLSVFIPLLLIFGIWALSLVRMFHPMVYDLYGYAIDGSLGFQPAVIVARWVQYSWAFLPVRWIYHNLPLLLVVTAILNWRHPKRVYNEPVLAFALAGGVGAMLYHIFPMIGLKAYFGKAFLEGPIPPVPPELFMVEAHVSWPRRCIPSLHMTWILLAFWSVRGIGWKVWIPALITVIATVLGTLNVGHYLIDLWVAFPFALAMMALSAYPTPENRTARWLAISIGMALTLAALFALRWGHTELARHGLLIYGLAMPVYLAVPLALEQYLFVSSVSNEPDPRS
jgi:hypothetical protein